MKVKCDLCHASYNIADDKVKGKAFRFSCKNCGNVVHVKPETAGASWYIAYAKKRKGPFSYDELSRHLLENMPSGEIHAWKAGFESWLKIEEVKELASIVEEFDKARNASRLTDTEQVEKVVSEKDVPANKPAVEKAETKEVKAVKEEVAKPEKAKKDTVRKPRPSFSELVAQSAPENGAAKKPVSSKTGKVDLNKLVQQVGVKPGEPAKEKPLGKSAKTSTAISGTTIKQYIPPEKKKIPIIQYAILTLLALIAFGTPLTLNYYHVIEIPGITKVPVIGEYFKVEEVDHYAELRDQWEMLVKIDEAKVKLQALKEEEFAKEKQRKLEEEERQRREERRQRLLAFRKAAHRNGGGGHGNANVTEISFGEEADFDIDFNTQESLNVRDIKRKSILDKAQVSKTIKKYMGRIGSCVAEQKRKQPMPGQLMVSFTINRRGTVVSTKVLTGRYKDTFVGDCIASVIERMRFPKSGGSVSMSYPFTIQ